MSPRYLQRSKIDGHLGYARGRRATGLGRLQVCIHCPPFCGVSSMPYRKLQDLNLPTSLDMLDRPLDLPPSLLGKAQEVRSEDGPRRIRGMIEDVQKLAAQDRILLNAVSILALFPLSFVPLTWQGGYRPSTCLIQSLRMMNCNARTSERPGHAHLLTRLINICYTTLKRTMKSWRRARWRIKLCVITGRSGSIGLKPLCLMRYTTFLLYRGLFLTSVVAGFAGLGRPRLWHAYQHELSLSPNPIARAIPTPIPRAA